MPLKRKIITDYAYQTEQIIVKVSVCVITFNQEIYIAQCLESILAQKCEFAFEVVIRDDFSLDNTIQIIRSYQNKFPKIVRLLNAEENIGANRNLLTVFSWARGDYLAICEGDDYWLDDNKLQKQIDLMERYPEITFTSHACRIHNKNGLAGVEYVKAPGSVVVTCNEVLEVSGQFAPTASYVFSKDLPKKLPSWFVHAPVGDFFIEMYGISMGKGMHMPDVMSAYRTSSINSWTTQNNEGNSRNLVNFSEKMIHCLKQMQTDPIFKGLDFSRKLGAAYFNIAVGSLLLRDFSKFQNSIAACYDSFPGLSLTQRILYNLQQFPLIAYSLYGIRHRIERRYI